MKPILIVWANALAVASASPSAAVNAASFSFFMSLLLEKLLPGAVVDRVFESRSGFDQSPTQSPLISVIEALAGIGHGRRVEDARNLELLGVEQPARLLDQVARVLARILVDRIGGPRLCLEHRGERRAVELVARRFAARRTRLHQHAHAAFLGDADPGLHQARRGHFAPGERVQALLHGSGEHPLDLLALEAPLEQLQRGEMRAVEGAHRDRLPLELLGLVDPRLGIGDDRESGHRRAQRHDLRGTMPRLASLHRALHDAPFAHAKLVALALVVERLHGALEYVLPQRLMVGIALPRSRRLHDVDVETLITEKTLVAGHEQRQVVDRVHHRNSHFLQGLRHGDSPPSRPGWTSIFDRGGKYSQSLQAAPARRAGITSPTNRLIERIASSGRRSPKENTSNR